MFNNKIFTGCVLDLFHDAREYRKISKYMSDSAILTAITGNEEAWEASIKRPFDLDQDILKIDSKPHQGSLQ